MAKDKGVTIMKKKADKSCSVKIQTLLDNFIKICEPLERDHILPFVDKCTNSTYCECHISAQKLISLGTIDVPLDPEEQQEYRANRDVVEDHIAFDKMKEDALNKRSFSNIVTEFTEVFDPEHPIKIIGGQHRYLAIKEALEKQSINENHGVKVYFGLDNDQRLDVQLISNTNIAASTDLLDRMLETVSGPELRNWCQEVGLLLESQDFSDNRKHGQLVTVKATRTFILNYFKGKEVNPKNLDITKTIPILAETGIEATDWAEFKKAHPNWQKDAKLKEAGKEFALLSVAQHKRFSSTTNKGKGMNIDYAEKALNYAIISAFAFVAGMLHSNDVRLKRHFDLRKTTSTDPLNAAALSTGRHKTDSENYRGLGYRTGPKERGRLVELFYLNTDKGDGISKGLVDLAIKKYEAKQALLEVEEAKTKI